MAINQLNPTDFDYSKLLETLNKTYKSQADITLSEYDTDAAPVVKAGSIFSNNGTLFENTADATPTGYSGISNSITFYLYYDESAGVFIFSATAPTWSDDLQGWYNGNDRAFFSMYKDSGGTLYQTKKKLFNPPQETLFIPDYGGVGSYTVATSTDFALNTEYLPDTTYDGSTLYRSTETGSLAGASFNGQNYSNLAVNSSSGWTSLNLTGTWRLLTRVYRLSTATLYPMGMFQRIS